MLRYWEHRFAMRHPYICAIPGVVRMLTWGAQKVGK
jgi:hypothetical protein